MDPQLTSCALISNTVLCEASRLQADDDEQSAGKFSRRRRVEHLRLFDVFAVIEAVVLHEKLYTLPARLELDGERLGLRSALLEAGLVAELDVAADHERLSTIIVESLANIKTQLR